MVSVSDTSKRQITTKKGLFFSHRWVEVKEWQNRTKPGEERMGVPAKLKCVYFNMASKCKKMMFSEDSYNI